MDVLQMVKLQHSKIVKCENWYSDTFFIYFRIHRISSICLLLKSRESALDFLWSCFYNELLLIKNTWRILWNKTPKLIRCKSLAWITFNEVQNNALKDLRVTFRLSPSFFELFECLSVESFIFVVVNWGKIAEDTSTDDSSSNCEYFWLLILIIFQCSSL